MDKIKMEAFANSTAEQKLVALYAICLQYRAELKKVQEKESNPMILREDAASCASVMLNQCDNIMYFKTVLLDLLESANVDEDWKNEAKKNYDVAARQLDEATNIVAPLILQWNMMGVKPDDYEDKLFVCGYRPNGAAKETKPATDGDEKDIPSAADHADEAYERLRKQYKEDGDFLSKLSRLNFGIGLLPEVASALLKEWVVCAIPQTWCRAYGGIIDLLKKRVVEEKSWDCDGNHQSNLRDGVKETIRRLNMAKARSALEEIVRQIDDLYERNPKVVDCVKTCLHLCREFAREALANKPRVVDCFDSGDECCDSLPNNVRQLCMTDRALFRELWKETDGDIENFCKQLVKERCGNGKDGK